MPRKKKKRKKPGGGPAAPKQPRKAARGGKPAAISSSVSGQKKKNNKRPRGANGAASMGSKRPKVAHGDKSAAAAGSPAFDPKERVVALVNPLLSLFKAVGGPFVRRGAAALNSLHRTLGQLRRAVTTHGNNFDAESFARRLRRAADPLLGRRPGVDASVPPVQQLCGVLEAIHGGMAPRLVKVPPESPGWVEAQRKYPGIFGEFKVLEVQRVENGQLSKAYEQARDTVREEFHALGVQAARPREHPHDPSETLPRPGEICVGDFVEVLDIKKKNEWLWRPGRVTMVVSPRLLFAPQFGYVTSSQVRHVSLERHLYHGCPDEVIERIAGTDTDTDGTKCGFDPDFTNTEKRKPYFGKGAYFSVRAAYSDQVVLGFYKNKKDDGDRSRRMFGVRVLTGVYKDYRRGYDRDLKPPGPSRSADTQDVWTTPNTSSNGGAAAAGGGGALEVGDKVEARTITHYHSSRGFHAYGPSPKAVMYVVYSTCRSCPEFVFTYTEKVPGFALSGVVGRRARVGSNARVAACNGAYALDPGGARVNGKPVFVHERGDRFAYYTATATWMVTDERLNFAKNRGWVESASSGSPSPADVCAGWRVHSTATKRWETVAGAEATALSADEASRVSARSQEVLRKAATLRSFALGRGSWYTAAINAIVARCNGAYALDPGGARFNGKPVFVHERGDCFAYYTTRAYWMVTDDRSDFAKNFGWVASASTGSPSPADVHGGWKVYNNTAKGWETVAGLTLEGATYS